VLCIEPGWFLAKLIEIVELILFAMSSFALLFIVQRTSWAKAPVVRRRMGTAEALPSRGEERVLALLGMTTKANLYFVMKSAV
jgi:hypothetical protein